MNPVYKALYSGLLNGTTPKPGWLTRGTGLVLNNPGYIELKQLMYLLRQFIISDTLDDLWFGQSVARTIITLEKLP
jgi:hypothetical protein